MARAKSPDGYNVSRWNRLTHAVELHGVMPSRGIEKCYHSERCPVAESEEWRHLCIAGEPCPYEVETHESYVCSARREYARCRAWLSDPDFEGLITELSFCELQLGRLIVLINREGILRDKRHPVSGILIGQQSGLGAGRYGDAIYGRFDRVYRRLMGPDWLPFW
jgi:hypothetical protein